MVTEEEAKKLRDAKIGDIIQTLDGKVRAERGIVCCMCRWFDEHINNGDGCPGDMFGCCIENEEMVIYEPCD